MVVDDLNMDANVYEENNAASVYEGFGNYAGLNCGARFYEDECRPHASSDCRWYSTSNMCVTFIPSGNSFPICFVEREDTKKQSQLLQGSQEQCCTAIEGTCENPEPPSTAHPRTWDITCDTSPLTDSSVKMKTYDFLSSCCPSFEFNDKVEEDQMIIFISGSALVILIVAILACVLKTRDDPECHCRPMRQKQMTRFMEYYKNKS